MRDWDVDSGWHHFDSAIVCQEGKVFFVWDERTLNGETVDRIKNSQFYKMLMNGKRIMNDVLFEPFDPNNKDDVDEVGFSYWVEIT